jgi:hypothetical protein
MWSRLKSLAWERYSTQWASRDIFDICYNFEIMFAFE